MKKKQTAKAKRQTLAKRIGAESDLIKKQIIAEGSLVLSPAKPDNLPQSKSEIESFIIAARFIDPTKLQGHPYASILVTLREAIVNKKFQLFSCLATRLQHGLKFDKSDDMYADILKFCNDYGEGGTHAFPCDAMRLTGYLKKLGYIFGDSENRVPRTLRAVCKKIGVVLTGQR